MTNTSLYREVFKNAWSITWRHKFLWIFGFFVALMLGNGGEAEALFNNFRNIMESPDTLISAKNLYQSGLLNLILSNIKYLFSTQPLSAIFILFVFIALLAALIWLAIVSQAALFDSVKKISNKEKADFGTAYKTGTKYFGQAFGINLIGRLVVWLLVVLISLPLVAFYILGNNTLGIALFVIVALVVLLPLMLIVSFVVKYSVAYVVIHDYKVSEAIKAGWKLFTKNWLVSIEMSLIILLISVVVGAIFILAAAFVSIPFILWALLALILATEQGFLSAIAIGMIPMIILLTILGAIFSSFQYAAWTLLFQNLVEAKGTSKIVRILQAAGDYFSKK